MKIEKTLLTALGDRLESAKFHLRMVEEAEELKIERRTKESKEWLEEDLEHIFNLCLLLKETIKEPQKF